MQNWMWTLLLFIALTLLVPLALLPQLRGLNSPVSLLLVYASVFYSGTRLAFLAFEGQEKILSLTFWVFAYVWLGVAPLAQLATDSFKWPGTYSEETQIYAGLIILLGYAAYDLGSWLTGSRKVTTSSRAILNQLHLSENRVYILGLLAIVSSVIGILLLPDTRMLFGPHEIVQAQIIATFSTAGSLLFFVLLRVPAFVALLLVWWMWLRQKEFKAGRPRSAGLPLLLAVLIGINILVSNPISSPRYFVGTLILSLVFVTFRWSSKHSAGVWVAGLLVILMVVFPYADLFRYEEVDFEVESVADKLAVSGDYDSFQQLMNTLEFVADNGFTLGTQLLGVLFVWVPRSIWTGKPIGSGELVAEYSGYTFTNLGSPLWAEAYIDFGPVWVAVSFCAYGVLTSVLQRAYLDRRLAYSSLLNVLVPLLAAYQIFFVRGALISTFAYLVPIVGYLLLAMKWRRTLKGETAPELGKRTGSSTRLARSGERR